MAVATCPGQGGDRVTTATPLGGEPEPPEATHVDTMASGYAEITDVVAPADAVTQFAWSVPEPPAFDYPAKQGRWRQAMLTIAAAAVAGVAGAVGVAVLQHNDGPRRDPVPTPIAVSQMPPSPATVTQVIAPTTITQTLPTVRAAQPEEDLDEQYLRLFTQFTSLDITDRVRRWPWVTGNVTTCRSLGTR